MHILLDLDGTLTNPEEGIVGCILHAFRELGRPPPDCDLTSYIGAPLADVFRELLETDDPRDVDAALAAYRARFATLGMFENEVYPGIPEALATLTAAGARLYLATAKPLVYAAKIVEHYGLARFFERLHGSELDGTRTDKRHLIAHILETERLDPSTTVMVGDRRHDVAGALHNRVTPYGVLWGFGTREELAAAGASRLLETPDALTQIAV